MDYNNLRNLLAEGQWQEADDETFTLIMSIAGADARGYLLPQDIEQFPCEALHAIDQLWRHYSAKPNSQPWKQNIGGHFGFSVQKGIYEEMGQNLTKLAEQVGWREGNRMKSYGELTFDLSAPVGHLPAGGYVGWLSWNALRTSFFSRLQSCNPEGVTSKLKT